MTTRSISSLPPAEQAAMAEQKAPEPSYLQQFMKTTFEDLKKCGQGFLALKGEKIVYTEKGAPKRVATWIGRGKQLGVVALGLTAMALPMITSSLILPKMGIAMAFLIPMGPYAWAGVLALLAAMLLSYLIYRLVKYYLISSVPSPVAPIATQGLTNKDSQNIDGLYEGARRKFYGARQFSPQIEMDTYPPARSV